MDYRDDIDDILDEFDFERVQTAMEALDWTWTVRDGKPSESYYPTVSDLRRAARRQLRAVADAVAGGHEEYTTGTGGFEARAYRDSDTGKIYMRLTFVVSDWDNWD